MLAHLPCEAHKLLWNALSASQAALQEHDGHHGRPLFQARDAGAPLRLMVLLLLSSQNDLAVLVLLVRIELHDVEGMVGFPVGQSLLKVFHLFVLGYAEQKVARPLLGETIQQEGEVVFAADVMEGIDVTNVSVLIVVLGAIVAWARAHHHAGLLSTVPMNHGGLLRVRRGRDREDVGVVLNHVFGGARHRETMLAEETTQRLILFGHQMCLVHHDQGAARRHGVLFEVLAEDDADLLLVFGGVVFLDILVTLAAEFRFMRSTQNVGAVNEALFHHHSNDAMVGARFARLDVGAEKDIANESCEDRKGGKGRVGLLGEHVGGQ